MEIAVVYYSLEGNTKFAAEKIAGELGADLIPLKPVREYPKGKFSKYFWAGKSATFREKPELEVNRFDAKQYDIVILGTPIWAGTFAPPLRSFVRKNRLAGKKAAIFACCSGGSTEKCFSQLKKELRGCSVLSTLRLVDPAGNDKPEEAEKIRDFCADLKVKLEQ